MNAVVLKSNKALVLIGNSPAWTTGQDSGYLFSLVQNSTASITNERQNLKQIGQQSYAVNDILRAPEVSLSMDYYLNPYLNNEFLLGFEGQENIYEPALSNIKNKNNNFYFLFETDDTKNAFEEAKKLYNTDLCTDANGNQYFSNSFFHGKKLYQGVNDQNLQIYWRSDLGQWLVDDSDDNIGVSNQDTEYPWDVTVWGGNTEWWGGKIFNNTQQNFSGFDAMTFGNCYLNSYNVNFSLRQIPTVSVGFAADNVRFENLTGNLLSIPAINSASGNNSGSGNLNLTNVYQTISGQYITGDAELRTEFNPRVAVQHASSFSLQSLQVGGIGIAASDNPILQSFDLSLALDRVPLYGLGSNYPYGRKLQYPINGQAQISCLVSGLKSGNWQPILTRESGYEIEVSFSDFKKLTTGYYKIDGAKLDNISYSLAVNGILQFNASFSFQATDSSGFFIKRITSGFVAPETQSWEEITSLWQNLNLTWESYT
jgi:hypothetical protein